MTEALGVVTGQSGTSYRYTKSNIENIGKGVKTDIFHIVDLKLVSIWQIPSVQTKNLTKTTENLLWSKQVVPQRHS